MLRDPTKRAQYDAMRRAGFTSAEDLEREMGADAGGGAAPQYGRSPFGRAGGADDFERAFEEWWRKHTEE